MNSSPGKSILQNISNQPQLVNFGVFGCRDQNTFVSLQILAFEYRKGSLSELVHLVRFFAIGLAKVSRIVESMNHYSAQWIEEWCQENGWSDWFMECSHYWAFPPNGVMPVPIPMQVLKTIKAEKGLCFEEKLWCLAAVLIALVAGVSTYFLASPMPLVAAFAFCAVTVARMEDDTLESTSSEGNF